MEYIFISPHLDDISLSCGGIVHQLTKYGDRVQIWTIFAGDPPSSDYPDFALSLHKRWKLDQDIVKIRRIEDLISCEMLGAIACHFQYSDCIYRKFKDGQPVVQKESDLYRKISGNQRLLVNKISRELNQKLEYGQILVAPLSIGNHLDHQIVKKSVGLLKNKTIYYYTDYPYNLTSDVVIQTMIPENYIRKSFTLENDDIIAWHKSVSAYRSQISTFWSDVNEMEQKIINYAMDDGGSHLWIPSITH